MSVRFDPETYPGLDKLGRVALSKSFHMREFLYSEIAVHYGRRNVPDRGRVDFAIAAGRNLCERLLEPLQDAFGRIHVRSGYRSRKVNADGFSKKHGCAKDNDGFHTWDYPIKVEGKPDNPGAVACISIPKVSVQVFKHDADPYAIAWWVNDNLPDWSCLEFFSTPDYSDELCFNIGWHERPMGVMSTWREGRGGAKNLREQMPSAEARKEKWMSLLESCR